MDSRYPKFPDATHPKTNWFSRLQTEARELSNAATDMFSAGVIEGLTLTNAAPPVATDGAIDFGTGSVTIAPGAAKCDDRSILLIEEAISIPNDEFWVQDGVAHNIWIYQSDETTVAQESNYFGQSKDVCVRPTLTYAVLAASANAPQTTECFLLGTIAAVDADGETGTSIFETALAGFSFNYAIKTLTHTGEISSGHYTGPQLNGDAIADDSITTDHLAAGAVETDDILDDAVTSAKIADGAVVEAALGTGAVTETKIADATITRAKFAVSVPYQVKEYDVDSRVQYPLTASQGGPAITGVTALVLQEETQGLTGFYGKFRNDTAIYNEILASSAAYAKQHVYALQSYDMLHPPTAEADLVASGHPYVGANTYAYPWWFGAGFQYRYVAGSSSLAYFTHLKLANFTSTIGCPDEIELNCRVPYGQYEGASDWVRTPVLIAPNGYVWGAVNITFEKAYDGMSWTDKDGTGAASPKVNRQGAYLADGATAALNCVALYATYGLDALVYNYASGPMVFSIQARLIRVSTRAGTSKVLYYTKAGLTTPTTILSSGGSYSTVPIWRNLYSSEL